MRCSRNQWLKRLYNHTSWSIKGGNNLEKIMAKKCSGRLNEVASKLKFPVFDGFIAKRIEKEILSASKIKKKTGKGYEYPVKGSLLLITRFFMW